jgi:hypothetical protein
VRDIKDIEAIILLFGIRRLEFVGIDGCFFFQKKVFSVSKFMSGPQQKKMASHRVNILLSHLQAAPQVAAPAPVSAGKKPLKVVITGAAGQVLAFHLL